MKLASESELGTPPTHTSGHFKCSRFRPYSDGYSLRQNRKKLWQKLGIKFHRPVSEPAGTKFFGHDSVIATEESQSLPEMLVLNNDDPGYQLLNNDDPGYQLLNNDDPGYQLLNNDDPGYQLLNNDDSGYQLLNNDDPGYQLLNNYDPGYRLLNNDDPGWGWGWG